jgi:hypothetical protein
VRGVLRQKSSRNSRRKDSTTPRSCRAATVLLSRAPSSLPSPCYASYASLTPPCWPPYTFILSHLTPAHLTQRNIYVPRTLFSFFPYVPPIPASRHYKSRQIDTTMTRHDFSLQLLGKFPRDTMSTTSIPFLLFPHDFIAIRMFSRFHTRTLHS